MNSLSTNHPTSQLSNKTTIPTTPNLQPTYVKPNPPPPIPIPQPDPNGPENPSLFEPNTQGSKQKKRGGEAIQ